MLQFPRSRAGFLLKYAVTSGGNSFLVRGPKESVRHKVYSYTPVVSRYMDGF